MGVPASGKRVNLLFLSLFCSVGAPVWAGHCPVAMGGWMGFSVEPIHMPISGTPTRHTQKCLLAAWAP